MTIRDRIAQNLKHELNPKDGIASKIDFRRILLRTKQDLSQSSEDAEDFVESALKIAFVNVPVLLVVGAGDAIHHAKKGAK